jgi:hypothetical protein
VGSGAVGPASDGGDDGVAPPADLTAVAGEAVVAGEAAAPGESGGAAFGETGGTGRVPGGTRVDPDD